MYFTILRVDSILRYLCNLAIGKMAIGLSQRLEVSIYKYSKISECSFDRKNDVYRSAYPGPGVIRLQPTSQLGINLEHRSGR